MTDPKVTDPKKRNDKTPVTAGKSKEALTADKSAADKAVTAAEGKVDDKKRELDDKKASLALADADLIKANNAAKKEGLAGKEKTEKDEAASAAKLRVDDLKAQVGLADKAKKTADGDLITARANAAAIGEALEGIGKSLGEAGDNLVHMGDNFLELADSYRAEKVNYLKLLMEKQDEEDKTLADMKQYALQMKNIDMQTVSLEVTVAALFQAIGALKKVVTNLQVAAQFWQNMADGCTALAKPSMAADIAAYKDLDAEDKHELYAEDEFKTSAVRYLAGWVGMQTIAKRYFARMTSIREQVTGDYGTYLGADAARTKAAELGGKLALGAQKAEAEGGKAKAEIQAALDEVTAEAPQAA